MNRKIVAALALCAALSVGSSPFTVTANGCGSTAGAGNCKAVERPQSPAEANDEGLLNWIEQLWSGLFG